MSQYARHYFKLNSNADYQSCSICTGLEDYTEIDNAAWPDPPAGTAEFPEETKRLKPIHKDLQLPFTMEGELRKCPECKTYYLYRSWSPGGSEDVFKTYNFESFSRIGNLGMFLYLGDAIEEWKIIVAENKNNSVMREIYQEHLSAFEKYGASEMEIIRKRPKRVLEDALLGLSKKPSTTCNKWYKDGAIASEIYVAKIITDFLALLPKSEKETIAELKKLTSYPNNDAKRIIMEALKDYGE